MDGALWMYALLVLTSAPPYLPNAALIASAGAMVHAGELSLPLVVLAAAAGALAGDAVIFAVGRLARGRALGWLGRSARRRAALQWTGERMHAHGLPFVVGARFLPSGRVIGGLTAALVDFPARRYLLGMGIAQAVWASYSVALGYWGAGALGGTLPSVLIACGISVLVACLARLFSGAGSRDAAAPTP
ncbi:DedA family protein [Streptomyces millisiae]|uniref:VTT domain-containing protein n=1 Tax=Streptomyces millisiae TaxID=3075542 RepID=A0ABU2LKY4_9ACTN|nr:VTT domain-containing protein [Streptomyces sp. DSM 44918]MDT0318262.1 VTT domain-containing protein [Streptomyces sp. DSM 44918]